MTYAMPGAFSSATIAKAAPAVMETATHGTDDLFWRGSLFIDTLYHRVLGVAALGDTAHIQDSDGLCRRVYPVENPVPANANAQ